MTVTTRHIVGLVLVVLLATGLYFGWEMLLTMISRWLRGTGQLRTIYTEFQLIIAAGMAITFLSLTQWIWDKTNKSSK